MKVWAKSFYNSKQWKALRRSYISQRMKIDSGMCEHCGEHIGYIVHHVQELTPANIKDPMVALNAANLMYVCKECHDKFDGHFAGVRRHDATKRVTFSGNGQPLPYLSLIKYPEKTGGDYYKR